MNGQVIGEYGDEDALSGIEREYLNRMRAIDEFGPARTLYISHGAGGDWFVVEPQVGTMQSLADTPISAELAVSRLVDNGRTVYELKPRLWRNKRFNKRAERVDLAWKPMAYVMVGVVLGVVTMVVL